MRFLTPILASASLLAMAHTASAQVDVDFYAPSSHNNANSHVFVGFAGAQKAGAPNPSSTEVNLIVNNAQTGFVNMSSVNGGLCNSGPTPKPGEYYEACGCYFDLSQVSLSGNDITFTAMYRSTLSGNVETGMDRMSIPKNGGPVRPAATAPMCAPINGNAPNLAPFADAGPDINVRGNDFVTLDGSASWDPDGDALTFSWFQTSGPTVALTNAAGSAPTFYAPAVTQRTILEFKVNVTDSQGNTSVAPDPFEVIVDPSLVASQCSAWTRDSIIDALSVQNGQGSTYTIQYGPTPTQQSAMQTEAQRVKAIRPTLNTYQLSSTLAVAGSGTAPGATTGGVPNASTVNFNVPPNGPLPTPSAQWSSVPFMVGTWYRLDTKINARDTQNNLVPLNGVYPDSCLYSTVYFQYDGQSLGPIGLRQFNLHDGTVSLGTSGPQSTGVILGTGAGGTIGQTVIGGPRIERDITGAKEIARDAKEMARDAKEMAVKEREAKEMERKEPQIEEQESKEPARRRLPRWLQRKKAE